jgi:hypothetical protein
LKPISKTVSQIVVRAGIVGRMGERRGMNATPSKAYESRGQRTRKLGIVGAGGRCGEDEDEEKGKVEQG